MYKLTNILIIALFATSALAYVFDVEVRPPTKEEWEEKDKGPYDDVTLPGTDITWGDIS